MIPGVSSSEEDLSKVLSCAAGGTFSAGFGAVAEGAAVKGTLTVNDDGTLTLTAGETLIPAGEYGTIEPVETSASGEASGFFSGGASEAASGEAS